MREWRHGEIWTKWNKMEWNGIYKRDVLAGECWRIRERLSKISRFCKRSLLGGGQITGSDPMVHAQFSGIKRRGVLRFSSVNSTTIITTTNMSSITLTAAERKAVLLEAWREREQVEQKAQEAEECCQKEEWVQEEELLKELEELEHREEEERRRKRRWNKDNKRRRRSEYRRKKS
jgi:hypothetical protein